MNFKNQSFIKSLTNALRGIKHSIGTERNLKIQLTMASIVIILAFSLKISLIEWAIIILTIGFVLVAEMINTAIETIVDMVCHEKYNLLARDAKDIAAGAVLTASIGACIVGIIIILPKIINFL